MTGAADWAQINDIVADALEQPSEARAAFVASACGDDAELRSAVDRLLQLDAEMTGFLDAPAALPVEEAPVLDSVGGYRLIRLIASGGAGAVYEAEQDAPRRTVAVG